MPKLIIQTNTNNSTVHELGETGNTIGRQMDNGIVIEDESVSGHHCEIISQNGKFILRDLNSSNGTMVNGQSIIEAPLNDNDAIVFGCVKATFALLSSSDTSKNNDLQNLGAVDKRNEGVNSAFSRIGKAALDATRRGTHLAALKAQIEKLKQIDLAKAHHALGEKAYHLRLTPEEFHKRYDDLAALEQNIKLKKAGLEGGSHATTIDQIKNVASNALMRVEAEALALKLWRQFVALGEQTVHSGNAVDLIDELACLAEVQSRIAQLTTEYQALLRDQQSFSEMCDASRSLTVLTRDHLQNASKKVAHALNSISTKRRSLIFGCLALVVVLIVVTFVTPRLFNPSYRHPSATKYTDPKSLATKLFWDRIQTIEQSANQQLSDMRLGDYPKVQSGFFDFQHFNDSNFETLRSFYEKRANIQFFVSKNLSAIEKLNVDDDLLAYANDLCEQWDSGGKYDYDFAKIVSTAYEQRTQFTTTSAYALRALTALNGDSRLEDRYKESQQIIDNMAKEWVTQRGVFQSNSDKLRVEEREIKTRLTRRYGMEYK